MEAAITLKHGVTLAMFIAGDLMLVIGSMAMESSVAVSIIGLALFTIGFCTEVNVWLRIARPHRAYADQPSR